MICWDYSEEDNLKKEITTKDTEESNLQINKRKSSGAN